MTKKMTKSLNEYDKGILNLCPKKLYQDIRRVSIESILHTDMVHHFPMVSEVKLLYEENVESLHLALEEYWNGEEQGLGAIQGQKATTWEMPPEVVEFWRVPEHTALMRRLVLHAGDVSNPFKPFPICRAWAFLVLEEFFNQGDLEKQKGLTVQMLNDRDKVNIPSSQLGFIEFVVFPLYNAFTTVMPSVHSCTEGLIANCRQWEAEWLEASNPDEDAQHKVHARIENLENLCQATMTLADA